MRVYYCLTHTNTAITSALPSISSLFICVLTYYTSSMMRDWTVGVNGTCTSPCSGSDCTSFTSPCTWNYTAMLYYAIISAVVLAGYGLSLKRSERSLITELKRLYYNKTD